MSKKTLKGKMLNKNNKTLGLSLVLITLLMIFSLVLFPYKLNPIVWVELLVMMITGYAVLLSTLIILLMVLLHYYLDINISWFSKKRMKMIYVLLLSSLMFISILCINGTLNYKISEIMPFIDYWKITSVTAFDKIISTAGDARISFVKMFRFNGIILPIILWVFGGFWWNGFITLIPLLLVILYSAYVVMTDEYIVIMSKVLYWRNDSKKIHVEQKSTGVDLNDPTEEFELNFDKVEIEEDKLELIEKVRKNMDNKNYDELSNKIAEEKQKLLKLRERVLAKTKQTKNEELSKSKVSDGQRNEIMASLGYTTYSALKSSIVRNEAKAQSKEPFRYTKPETYVEEEKVEENVALINEGYKTTEQVIDVNAETLVDTFVEDMLDSFDPTQELPLLENYSEIFNDEESLVDEINKTLETILELEDELSSTAAAKEQSEEIVIEGLDQEVTVEDYLSIPDAIAKSQEQTLNLNQTEAIAEQQQDRTKDSEYSSISKEQTSEDEEAINLISEPKEEPVLKPFTYTGATYEPKEESAEVMVESVVQEVVEEVVVTEPQVEDTIIKVEEEAESEFDPANWCKPYVLPSTSILSTPQNAGFDNSILVEEANNKARALNTTFQSFGVKAEVNSFEIGPTITTFKISLDLGIKTTKVTNLEDNIKLALGAEYIRILAPIPGTSFIGIEIPNSTKRPVLFKDVYNQTNSDSEGITISIGQDVSGKSLSFDLTKAPHLLVAGSTGSGKSVAINTILASILLRYKPTDVQLVLVDPKMVEFAPFHGVPHLLAEVITDAQNANNALKAMVDEMEERYKQMASMGVKKLEELNAKLIAQGENKLPYIVVIIDELADLMMVAAKEVEESIMRITQKARAAGIHMILATQRPSTEIITGTIKSNIPSRMAFTVASSIYSRTILGQVGSEKLIGMGDMLVSLYGQLPFRGQGAFISNEEVEDIASFTKSQCSANYKIDVQSLIQMSDPMTHSLISINDPLYIAARDTVIHYQKATTSMLQRHLNIGYNKAANIIETLEEQGVIGPAKGSQPREVLIS